MEGRGILLRRPHGYVTIVDPDGMREFDSLRCCHCQKMWLVKPGSGNRRGWCSLCGDVTCGAPACQPCVPFEKQLDMQERREKLMQALQQ